jgi:hypothetical protein
LTTNQLDEAIDGQQQNIHFLSSQALSYNNQINITIHSCQTYLLFEMYPSSHLDYFPPTTSRKHPFHITQSMLHVISYGIARTRGEL